MKSRSKILVMAFATGAMIFSSGWPVLAISVDLAKKCREMAIKAHPLAPAGTKAYAEAQRAYFRQCVTNDGNMDDNSSSDKPNSDGPN
jgi:hypothetical protein